MTIEKELARIDALLEAREKTDFGEVVSCTLGSGHHGVCEKPQLFIIAEGMDKAESDFFAIAANELKPLLENYKRALEVVRFYGDPLSWPNRDGYILIQPDDRAENPFLCGGKRARAFTQSLYKESKK